MSAKNSIIVNIKGRDWAFVLVGDKSFDKQHNEDGSERPAVTMPNQYLVHFRKSDWCVTDIIHELGHVLFSMSDVESANLTPDQVEEMMCQIIAKNYFDIGRWASLIAEKFFGRQ